MTNLQYFLCGGAGINIGMALTAAARTSANKKAAFVGFDTSDKNDTDLFPIERLEGVSGSGKDSTVHFPAMASFAATMLKKYKPGRHNVVVANAAGGTGRAFAMLLVKMLLEAEHEVFLYLIEDHTSLTEKQNSVKGLQTFYNLVDQLGKPVAYMSCINENTKTRGQMNTEIIDSLNLLSILFNEGNTEIDDSDIANFFNYSYNGKVAPALSRLDFFDQQGAVEYEGKLPVALASLFMSSDDVIPRFVGSVYRTTGVFSSSRDKTEIPKDVTELHFTLDHGDSYAAIKKAVDDLETSQSEATNAYGKQKAIKSEGANEMGFML